MISDDLCVISGAAKFCDDVDAILLNIAGRLIMLSPQSNERRGSGATRASMVHNNRDGPVQNQVYLPLFGFSRRFPRLKRFLPFQLEPPLLVASYVEEVWVDLQWRQSADGATIVNGDKPHLSQALWIQCGCRGMRVWMPLFPKSGERYPHQAPQQQFISKRIMLPFELSSMHSLGKYEILTLWVPCARALGG